MVGFSTWKDCAAIFLSSLFEVGIGLRSMVGEGAAGNKALVGEGVGRGMLMDCYDFEEAISTGTDTAKR